MGSSDQRRAPTLSAADSASRSLHALAVFQHLSNLELVKSVHLYVDDGTFTAIQQEFLLSPGAYSQISEPIPSYFSKFAPMGAEQFMGTLKRLNELDMWQCVLEFHINAPLATSIMPLLSVSRNSSLRAIPNLANDLGLVEKAIDCEMQTLKCVSLSGHPSSCVHDRQGYGCQQISNCQQISPDRAPFWNPAKWNFPAVSATTGHSAESSDTRAEGLPDGSQLQVETLHEWGSDLELASPRMFDTCVLGSSWNNSISSMPLTALISVPSPTSSLVTSHKPGCSSWSPPSLLLNSLGGACDYNIESSSSQNNLGHMKLSSNSEMSNVGASLNSCRQDPIGVPIIGKSLLPSKVSLRRVVERTRSHCSDESVCTPTGSDRQASGLSLHSLASPATNLRLSDCRNDVCYQETSSSQLTEPSLSRKEGVTTRNMLEKMSGHSNLHQRGPTERMTEITLSELSNYFNMPITQASKELKVGLTVLKKRCREFGIPRWPHRKMKSLDSLIHNIQELAKGPEGKTSAPVMNAVKELEHQKKRMEERPGIELAERTKRLRQACFKASYKKRRQAQTLAQQEPYEVSGVVPVDQCVSTLVS